MLCWPSYMLNEDSACQHINSLHRCSAQLHAVFASKSVPVTARGIEALRTRLVLIQKKQKGGFQSPPQAPQLYTFYLPSAGAYEKLASSAASKASDWPLSCTAPDSRLLQAGGVPQLLSAAGLGVGSGEGEGEDEADAGLGDAAGVGDDGEGLGE